ncbi:Retrovirus-related Pol polyprotein from transposon 17.6, partial [Mucuna pruriens]
MKHPTENHSLFSINVIEELVEEYSQLSNSSGDMEAFAGSIDENSCLGVIDEETDLEEVQDLPNSEDNHSDIADLDFEVELSEMLDQVWNQEHSECINDAEGKINVPPGFDSKATQDVKVDSNLIRTEATESSQLKQPKAEIMSAHLVPSRDLVGQMDSSPFIEKSPSPPPIELKPLPSHLKYAYLDIIIANNLHQEQEDKLLKVLRQHKKAIGWKLSDLPSINPSIFMHKILMKEEVKPVRQQQRRLNPTILDVVKKEVSQLLTVGIIYPISNNQWVSLVQVVPKIFGMTVMKNQQDELVSTRIQNSWRVCIDQVLEKLSRKSYYCFLDGFSGYMQIHISSEDQHKTIFTCPFGTFAYTRMPFDLCNAPSTFQRCMTNIFLDLLQDCMEVFMDDFMMYVDSFETCLSNLSKVLKRCIDTNLILNFEKCHFMVTKGIVSRHLVSNRGIEVDKAKIDAITSLPNPASVREVRSFLGCAGFYRRFIKNFNKLALPLPKLLQKDVEFNFDRPCIEAF